MLSLHIKHSALGFVPTRIPEIMAQFPDIDFGGLFDVAQPRPPSIRDYGARILTARALKDEIVFRRRIPSQMPGPQIPDNSAGSQSTARFDATVPTTPSVAPAPSTGLPAASGRMCGVSRTSGSADENRAQTVEQTAESALEDWRASL